MALFGATQPQANPNFDVQVSNAQNDTISSLVWSPTSNLLATGSWNKEVRVWDVAANGTASPKAFIQHNAPVLCCAFSSDGTRVFSGSCDNIVKHWPLGHQATNLGAHDAPIKEVAFSQETGLVVTGSWDKTVKLWDPRVTTGQAAAHVQMPERVYCMDVRGVLMVVGTAERHVCIYDLRNMNKAFRSFQSPLKFQSRCIASFPDRTGFALGSIEGRVAISHVEDKDLKKNFAFKCHRHGQNSTEVYAVNGISFHEKFGTFATYGSDGGYVFWDKDSKQRLKLFQRMPMPITAGSFNRDGTIFGYATGYDWSKGADHWDKTKVPQIYLHGVQDAEIAPR